MRQVRRLATDVGEQAGGIGSPAMSYPPFPTGGGNWVTERPLQAPDPVVNAVRFMYAGAGLEIVNLVWTVASIGTAARIVRQSQPTYTASQAHAVALVAVILVAFGSLVGAALWLWMARMNAAGRSWARTVATVLFAIDTIAVLLQVIGLVKGQGLGGSIIAVVAWFVGLFATIWLWREESSLYFAEVRYRSRVWHPGG
jgi:hypothetical protein